MVWYGVNPHGVIGFEFFENKDIKTVITVNNKRYIEMMENFVQSKLTRKGILSKIYF